jgi:hypothetical protein
MKKRYVVNLTADEREALEQIVDRERVVGAGARADRRKAARY